MDFSTAVTLDSFFLTLGGVSILFSSEDILQLYGCWSAVMHLKCIWRLFQLYLRTSYTCYTYSNFCLFCYTLCNKSFQVIRHCLNTFLNTFFKNAPLQLFFVGWWQLPGHCRGWSLGSLPALACIAWGLRGSYLWPFGVFSSLSLLSWILLVQFILLVLILCWVISTCGWQFPFGIRILGSHLSLL